MATPQHRALIRARALTGDPDARFVDNVLRRREAGLTRQRTVAEIAPCVHGVWCPDTRCADCRGTARAQA